MFSRLALAQINPVVGDIAGNVERVRRARLAAAGKELLACPELALSGYPPEDLVLRSSFRAACREAAMALAADTEDGGPALLIGCPWEENGETYNAALLLDGGRVTHIHRKIHLPNYGVFDERRIFSAGPAPRAARFRGKTLGILVCEDIWYTDAARILAGQGAERLIVINASPFERGKLPTRQAVCARAGMPVAYVNMVGGQDDIVFDGGAFATDEAGSVIMQAPQFTEGVFAADLKEIAAPLLEEKEVWKALSLGLGDYVRKNGFSGVLLGLSGGIDSALAATLAVDALGADAVLGVLLPSEITSSESIEDALALAKNLGIKTETVSIAAAHAAVHGGLERVISKEARASLAVDGNIQSRLRSLMLMALSNASGRMLISTANKSEVAVGYTTLYGDSCGGYAPLKDVYKTEVYRLARWRNIRSAVIPERSIAKAPSAELAPGQKDEDQLPPYLVLDTILECLVERALSIEETVSEGHERGTVSRVAAMLGASEYKRRQMPPGAKISPMLFGRDRRYPLTSGWKE